MKSKKFWSAFASYLFIIFIWLFLGTSSRVSAQEKTEILKVKSTTEDAVDFQISTAKTKYNSGENITVDYVVRNKSKNNIYLVVAQEPDFSAVKNSEILHVKPPVKYPNEFTEYKFTLMKITSGKTFKGKLVLEGSKVQVNNDYANEVWQLQAGFSYLFDISNLTGCGETNYHLPCLTEIYNKSKSLVVGNLIINIKNH